MNTLTSLLSIIVAIITFIIMVAAVQSADAGQGLVSLILSGMAALGMHITYKTW